MIPDKIGKIISGWIPSEKPVQSADATAQDQNIKLQPNTPGRLETAAVIGFILTAPISLPLALAFGAGFYGTKGLIALGSLLSNQLSKLLSPPAQSQKNLEKELAIVALVKLFPDAFRDETSRSTLNETIDKTTEVPQETVGGPTEEHSNETEGGSGLTSGEFQKQPIINEPTGVSGPETLEVISTEENQKMLTKEARKKLRNERREAAVNELFIEINQKDNPLLQKLIKTEVAKLRKGTDTHIFQAAGREYVISKVLGGDQKTVAIEISSKEEVIGEGKFSKVSALKSRLVQAKGDIEIEGAKKWVVKEPIGSNVDVEQDFEISTLLNMNGPKPGIPSAYRLVKYGDSVIEVMPNYEFGGKDFIKKDGKAKAAIPPDEISSVVSQVTEGLEHMQKEGVFLRDIKTENFRANINENKKIEIVFTDFGGALFNFDQVKNDVENGNYPSSTTLFRKAMDFGKGVSSAYIPLEVRKNLRGVDFLKLIKDFEYEEDKVKAAIIFDAIQTKLTAEVKRWGQYATGISLYEMLTGEEFGEGKDWEDKVEHWDLNVGYFQFTDKDKVVRAREHMESQLKKAGANEADRKKIIDLVFPPPVPTEGTV